MKLFTKHKSILLAGLFFAGINSIHAQNNIARSNFSWFYANHPNYNPYTVQIKSTEGTVCNSGTPSAHNYNLTFGQPSTTGGVHYNDSTGITNDANNTPTNQRFKAIAGKPFIVTVDLYVSNSNIAYGSMGYNTIEGQVKARIGTFARNTANTHNSMFDTTINFTQTGPPVIDNLGRHYTFQAACKFKRGSKSGHLFLEVPVKDYAGQIRYEEFIVPYLVFGPLDEQVPHIGITTEPKIPYMVLHDPPGDGSNATLGTTVQNCRSLEESYTSASSNNVFGSVKLGLKGSVGLIATVDYEIFAEFSASATIGDIKIGATSTQSCISVSNSISTSSLDPNSNTSDLFIGYGMDMYYGLCDYLEDSACSYKIAKGLIYRPVDGTTTQFVYTKNEILNDIATLQAGISTPGTTAKDSARALYQIHVWNQVLNLNDFNIAHPNEAGATPKAFAGGGFTETYSRTIDINQSNTISVEHYIDAEAGLQGVVNIAGSGFSVGYKYTTSKKFGNTSINSTQTSQTISYTLTDDDAGDLFNTLVVTDPMYGTPLFQLRPGTKTSCPYEGGIQRDQPRLQHVGTNADTIVFPNVTEGAYQSFYLKIANNSAEARAYRLRLKNNVNNAAVTVNGNTGPEFTPVTGIPLGAKGSGSDSVIYLVDVHQLNPNSLSFPQLEFELYDICTGDIAESVFATVNYGSLVRSAVSGSWNTVTTWEAGRVPQPTDSVIINNNHVITMPVSLDLKCKAITLKANSNLILPKNTKLTVKGN